MIVDVNTGKVIDLFSPNWYYESSASHHIAVSMKISKRGLALASEMEPFIDTYETTCTLLKGVGHIGSERMIHGNFADVLADNYQNELKRLQENYFGKEFDKQLEILDKAYEEAATNASIGYVKQLRVLTQEILY